MLTTETASAIIDTAFTEGRSRELQPLCAVVLDAGGNMLALKRHERSSNGRVQIALAKASGCIGLGVGGRTLAKMASERPVFVTSLMSALPNGCAPVPGGLLIRDNENTIIGAIGVTGDLSDNDEACGLAGIEAAGLVADAG